MKLARLSALARAYDPTIRYNQWILALSAAGGVLGLILAGGEVPTRLLQAFVCAATAFMAAAVAKEFDPDRPWSSPIAAALVLPLMGLLPPISPAVLLWVVLAMRFLNHSAGARPRPTDLALLLAVSAALAWWLSPLFGVLAGVLLFIEALLPGGRKLHAAVGLALATLSGVWMMSGGATAMTPSLWLVVVLMAVAIGVIPVILNSYVVMSVGDADGRPLNPVRVQAGQSFALGVGLTTASWLGNGGVALLAGLWAALLAVLVYNWVITRLPRSVLSPE